MIKTTEEIIAPLAEENASPVEVERAVKLIRRMQKGYQALSVLHDCNLEEKSTLRAQLAAAEQSRDEAVREVERLREALEWIVEPDIPIGSNAEFQHLATEVAKAALLQPAKEALDAVPAAEPKALDEVKAVLAEVLASQPMAKVWAEAAINAMCGKVVGDAAAEGGEREIIDAPKAADPRGEEG